MSELYSEDFNGNRDNAWALHVVRNPWGWSEDDQRRARLMIADAYEASIGGQGAYGYSAVVPLSELDTESVVSNLMIGNRRVFTDREIKKLMQNAGFHNTQNPYEAAGTMSNFKTLADLIANEAPTQMTMERLQTALLAAGAFISVDPVKEEPRMVTIRLKFDRLGDLVKGLG